jgi:glutamate dehydrogenase (NAD(P)+)
MVSAWNAVKWKAEEYEVPWREAAYIVVLERIADAHETRGLWP